MEIMSTQQPDLRTAAQAVIDRWETPLWKDAPATAGYIAALRDALAAAHTEHRLDMVDRWYMVDKDGMATRCADQKDAEFEAKDADAAWPEFNPHRAVLLVEASFDAEDMATAAAQGFRDGVASVAASAGEPRDLNPRHIRKFLQALQAGEMSVSRAVEILDAWVDGYYKDEMVPPPPPDSCLIADDEFPMEIVRKLRSELAAAPPTAQAGGWMPIETAPKDSGYLLLRGGREQDVASGYWLQAAYAGNGAWIWPFVHMTPRFWAHLPPTSAEGVEHG